MQTNGLPELKDNFCCICVHGENQSFFYLSTFKPSKKARQNILISYTYKSFAARIGLVLRESQEKINVEILQIGLAKNWTGKI